MKRAPREPKILSIKSLPAGPPAHSSKRRLFQTRLYLINANFFRGKTRDFPLERLSGKEEMLCISIPRAALCAVSSFTASCRVSLLLACRALSCGRARAAVPAKATAGQHRLRLPRPRPCVTRRPGDQSASPGHGAAICARPHGTSGCAAVPVGAEGHPPRWLGPWSAVSPPPSLSPSGPQEAPQPDDAPVCGDTGSLEAGAHVPWGARVVWVAFRGAQPSAPSNPAPVAAQKSRKSGAPLAEGSRGPIRQPLPHWTRPVGPSALTRLRAHSAPRPAAPPGALRSPEPGRAAP